MIVSRPPPTTGPVRERTLLPDVLRGVALLGILIVNMQDFAGFNEWQQRGPDRAAQVLTDVLANGRFISIFAMLFGWGAAGMLARQGAWLLLRRHLLLLLIGSLHFVLVWHGDIIENYALLGLALLLVGRLGARALLAAAALSGGWWLLSNLLEAARYFTYPPLPRQGNLPELSEGMTYAQVVAQRAPDFLSDLIGSSIYNGPWLIALFCLGAAAQRSGLLTRPQDHLRLFKHFAVWGTGMGVALGSYLAYLNTQADFASGVLAIPVRMGGGLVGALGYVGLLGLLAAQGRLGWWRSFANSGRIAMSNYLAQSLVMTSIFYPYAGAQWGHWGAASALALALGFGLLQVWLSGFIVRRFGSGPMEKLVRRLLYGPVN